MSASLEPLVAKKKNSRGVLTACSGLTPENESKT
jgi:hypothetical protein